MAAPLKRAQPERLPQRQRALDHCVPEGQRHIPQRQAEGLGDGPAPVLVGECLPELGLDLQDELSGLALLPGLAEEEFRLKHPDRGGESVRLVLREGELTEEELRLEHPDRGGRVTVLC